MSAFGSVSETRMKFACAGCCLLWNKASISLRSTESRHSSRSLSLTRWILSSLKTDCAYRSAQLWVKFISGSRGEPKNQLLLSWIISWATNTHSRTHGGGGGDEWAGNTICFWCFSSSQQTPVSKAPWEKTFATWEMKNEREGWEREEERKRAGEERTRLSLSL